MTTTTTTAENTSCIFIGPIIHSLSLEVLEYIPRGILVVSNGKIVHLEKETTNVETRLRTQYGIDEKDVHTLKYGQFLIPGFVDTHIHGPQYPNVGLGYDLPLLDWLKTYTFPLEKKFQDEKFAEKVYDAVIAKTLAHGTTTASYFATIHLKSSMVFANCLKARGQRGFVGKVNMNKNVSSDYVETHEQSLADTRALIEYVSNLNSPLVRPIVTPRFALSCDMDLMTALGRLAADHRLPIQTHISENTEEVKLVKSEFPDCKNYLDVYDRAGLVNERTVLAHGIHLEPDELRRIRETNATISHCPQSNILLQSGVCPVYEYLKSGINVSLGTDCSGGNSCSILDSIRHTLMLSIQASFNNIGKRLTVEEVFYMATMGGAKAMNLENVIGNFETGKDFDAILVDLNDDLDLLEDYTLEQLFQKFIYLGDDRVMKRVFVAGKTVKHVG